MVVPAPTWSHNTAAATDDDDGLQTEIEIVENLLIIFHGTLLFALFACARDQLLLQSKFTLRNPWYLGNIVALLCQSGCGESLFRTHCLRSTRTPLTVSIGICLSSRDYYSLDMINTQATAVGGSLGEPQNTLKIECTHSLILESCATRNSAWVRVEVRGGAKLTAAGRYFFGRGW